MFSGKTSPDFDPEIYCLTSDPFALLEPMLDGSPTDSPADDIQWLFSGMEDDPLPSFSGLGANPVPLQSGLNDPDLDSLPDFGLFLANDEIPAAATATATDLVEIPAAATATDLVEIPDDNFLSGVDLSNPAHLIDLSKTAFSKFDPTEASSPEKAISLLGDGESPTVFKREPLPKPTVPAANRHLGFAAVKQEPLPKLTVPANMKLRGRVVVKPAVRQSSRERKPTERAVNSAAAEEERIRLRANKAKRQRLDLSGL